MRRVLLIASVILAGSTVPAPAAVVTSTAIAQSFNAQGGIYHPTGFTAAALSLYTEIRVSTQGTTATPDARFEAYSWVYDCDLAWSCTTTTYPLQTVSLTAFQMDPAGNSGTFRACLLPSSGACRQFVVTITRPGYIAPQCGTICLSPNAWFDPFTNTVGGNAYAAGGVHRQGYTVTGSFGGVAATLGNGFSSYMFGPVHSSSAS